VPREPTTHQFCACHREFLPKLEKCGKDFNQIAQLLLGEGSKMAQIYVGYCQGKTQSEALIIEHRPFFDRLQMELTANESLSSYLIRPIQRITKFPLMLKVCFPCILHMSMLMVYRILYSMYMYIQSFIGCFFHE